MNHTREDLILDLTNAVDELVQQRTHAEPHTVHNGSRWENRRHLTRHPSLLDQLRTSIISSSSGQDGPRPAFGSKPAARLEAIDRLIAIENGAATWVAHRMHLELRNDAEGNLRSIVGNTAQLDDAMLGALVSDARRWRVWARVTTGWDEPPFRPHSTCPLCGVRGSLRVRVADRAACCVDCGEAWDSATITLLAEHIRAENDDDALQSDPTPQQ